MKVSDKITQTKEALAALSAETTDFLKEISVKVGYFYKVGDKVSWRYGGGKGQGTIKKKYEAPVTKTIKGTEVTRNASPETPAYLIETDEGDQVLKLATEIDNTSRDAG